VPLAPPVPPSTKADGRYLPVKPGVAVAQLPPPAGADEETKPKEQKKKGIFRRIFGVFK
jgi:hypothetical protein